VVGLTAVAATLGLSYTAVGINHWKRITADPEPQIARLRQSILRGERLVSFGPLPSRFTFFYRDPVEIHPWPDAATPPDPRLRYFCFLKDDPRAAAKLPFAWEQVALICCERSKEDTIHNVVVVGRRMEAGREPGPSLTGVRPPGTATIR
jgi:hypothetical protein